MKRNSEQSRACRQNERQPHQTQSSGVRPISQSGATIEQVRRLNIRCPTELFEGSIAELFSVDSSDRQELFHLALYQAMYRRQKDRNAIAVPIEQVLVRLVEHSCFGSLTGNVLYEELLEALALLNTRLEIINAAREDHSASKSVQTRATIDAASPRIQ